MDFSLTDEQQSVRELAGRIFGDLSDHEHLKKAEQTDDRFDRALWRALADAGLLGMAVPEDWGGAGLGFVEACIVVEEAGRAAAAAPVTAVTVLGAAPIVRFGTDDQRREWLARICAGDLLISAALAEPGGDPRHPVTTASRHDGGWRIDGTKAYVPAGAVADAVIVSASSDEGVGLFVVDCAVRGVTRRLQHATDGRLEAELEFDGVEIVDDAVLVVPGDGAGEDALAWSLERAMAAMCVEVAGACQAALKLTAEYASQRRQFDKVIATFQAVGQRAADAYIDTEAVRLTAWHAVWRLANDLPASAEVAVAKFWADDGAQRVVHAAQHLHGGVGVDRDYPLHRYYLLTKHLALSLGGGTTSLLRLGDLLATTPA